jgi:hypothetical protein
MAFSRFLKSALIVDCMLVLFLTSGFVLPGKSLRDPKAGSQPGAYEDAVGKSSPFAPPAPDPVRRKVEIPLITARGEHPTFSTLDPFQSAWNESQPDPSGASASPAAGSQAAY